MKRAVVMKVALASSAALALSGCVTALDLATYSARDAGFHNVALVTEDAVGKQAQWIQDPETAQELAEKVKALVDGKTIDADTAVQVALLNNRGLQAAYADVGLSAAEVWQQTMPPNPKLSIGVFGFGAPGFDVYRSLEGMIANNILALLTQKQRIEIADTNFQAAQLRAIEATLRLAHETRRAWIEAVAAFEQTVYLNQAQKAADAASELAMRLGESGAMPKGAQAREHAFFAELTGQKAQARLAAKLAKEALTRKMGLWGQDMNYFVPDFLPRLPGRPGLDPAVESTALRNRVDLQMARLTLEANARRYGLTEATRYVTDLDLLAGAEKEIEIENGEETSQVTWQGEIDFAIPIFDTGKARLRKAELEHMRAANLVAERAVNIRSEARAAQTALRATHDIARHYENAVLPLRTAIEEEALLTYNGMITNTFELLADTRARVNTVLMAGQARRDFWIADATMKAVIHGGGANVAAPQMAGTPAEGGGSPH